ncbi:40S ribosomal protein S2-like [Arvicola amphibius]|uniref:40S ribosomal protein S2-like n=1 Tax=Arvicola amphibius TaxID=1047088 RepID=UPI001C09E4E0|nr:40S ribosomal protein S2-like [Arvicola amphibius]
MKIKSLEEICLFSLPIKESEIIDIFLSAFTNDEALKIMPVQKQIEASQQTRFKIFATTGTTMVIGCWGNKIGKPHLVPYKVTGYYGSVLVHLIPAPRSTDTVSASVSKKILIMAGMGDCYTLAKDCTASLGNFAKATFNAFSKTYSYLTPNLWKDTTFPKSP